MPLNALLVSPLESHSTRSEWIEIGCALQISRKFVSLTPHGVSGLKSLNKVVYIVFIVVSLHTE